MPPPLLFDLKEVDLSAVRLTQDEIYALLPHRHEFMVLDVVCHADLDARQITGYADLSAQDWWCRGHVPDRAILPGVLMLEMGAQLSAVLAKLSGRYDAFIGFGGVDQCKFREAVFPPARLFLLAASLELRPRRIVSAVQGVIDDRIIFEATLVGLIIP